MTTKITDTFTVAASDAGLTDDEIRAALTQALQPALDAGELRNVLILPPDFTRFHSNAGFITNFYYRFLTERGVNVDVLPALGTHVPVSETQWKTMFGDIPFEKMIVHNWRTDVMKLGDIPAEAVEEISGGLWKESLPVEVNKLVMDPKYDLVISPGQVVPHEVIGMANHAKNLCAAWSRRWDATTRPCAACSTTRWSTSSTESVQFSSASPSRRPLAARSARTAFSSAKDVPASPRP